MEVLVSHSYKPYLSAFSADVHEENLASQMGA